MRIESSPLFRQAPVNPPAPAPASAPAEPVDGVGPAVDLRTASRVLAGSTGALKPAWRVEFPDGFFYSSENYGGPAPVRDNHGFLYAGDSRCFRRLSPDSGSADWEVRLPEGHEFRSGDPVVAGRESELLVLPYRRETGPATSKDGFCAVDVRTGQVRFMTRGDHPITGARADAAGNLYYGTITGSVVKVDPSGQETLLNQPRGFRPNILDVKVRPDGVAWWSPPISSALHRTDGLLDEEIPLQGQLSYPSSTQLAADGGVLCLTSLEDSQVLHRITPDGEVAWTAAVPCRYGPWTAMPDGGAAVMIPGTPARVVRFGPDGAPAWEFPLADPALRSGNSWSDGRLVALPQGDLVLIDPNRATMLCLGSHGAEKWRNLPEEFPHDAYWPLFSFTDEKVYVTNRGGVRRVDLQTGTCDLQYCRDRQFMRRGEERLPLTGDLPRIAGNVVEGATGELYTFDRDAGFMKLELPQVGVQEEIRKAAAALAAGEISLSDSHVNIGGITLPVRSR